MNIKHPCNPKPVCRCIAIALMLQDGSHDFNLAGINLVYSRFRPGVDSQSIFLVYPGYIPFS
jgi:hypothetical protein